MKCICKCEFCWQCGKVIESMLTHYGREEGQCQQFERQNVIQYGDSIKKDDLEEIIGKDIFEGSVFTNAI